jgi:hypothetical protein
MFGLRRRVPERRRGRLAFYGVLGALYGGSVMTLVRLGLHRAGLIDKMVPQAVTEWLSHELDVDPPRHPASDQLVHLGYSATWGALAGLALFGAGATPLARCRRRVRSRPVGSRPSRPVPAVEDRSTRLESFHGRELHRYRDPRAVWSRRPSCQRGVRAARVAAGDLRPRAIRRPGRVTPDAHLDSPGRPHDSAVTSAATRRDARR